MQNKNQPPNIVITPPTPTIPEGNNNYDEGERLYKENENSASLPYFHKADEEGCLEASLRLWRLYEGDLGVCKSEEKQAFYKNKVEKNFLYFANRAHKNNATADAQYNLAVCYANGLGIQQNWSEAAKYYRLATQKGHASTECALAMCYASGSGLPQDWRTALIYYRRAAVHGDAWAACHLGHYYYTDPLNLNFETAIEYFRIAAQKKHPTGRYNLAMCYLHGVGTPQNLSEAIHYFDLAALQGYADAQFTLGLFYKDGRGVLQNLARAAQYFHLAASQGNGLAKTYLEQLLLMHPHLETRVVTPVVFSPSDTSSSSTTTTTTTNVDESFKVNLL